MRAGAIPQGTTLETQNAENLSVYQTLQRKSNRLKRCVGAHRYRARGSSISTHWKPTGFWLGILRAAGIQVLRGGWRHRCKQPASSKAGSARAVAAIDPNYIGQMQKGGDAAVDDRARSGDKHESPGCRVPGPVRQKYAKSRAAPAKPRPLGVLGGHGPRPAGSSALPARAGSTYGLRTSEVSRPATVQVAVRSCVHAASQVPLPRRAHVSLRPSRRPWCSATRAGPARPAIGPGTAARPGSSIPR